MRQSLKFVTQALGRGGIYKGIMRTRHISEFFYYYPVPKAVEYLFQAVNSGDENKLINALDSEIDPNSRDEENKTHLIIAAEKKQIHLIPHLLIHGANVNLQDNLGETALMKAARESYKDIVQFLLDNEAQVDVLNYENMTALDVSRDIEIDEMLENAKGDCMKENKKDEHH